MFRHFAAFNHIQTLRRIHTEGRLNYYKEVGVWGRIDLLNFLFFLMLFCVRLYAVSWLDSNFASAKGTMYTPMQRIVWIDDFERLNGIRGRGVFYMIILGYTYGSIYVNLLQCVVMVLYSWSKRVFDVAQVVQIYQYE